jgi:hypothetical protein
METLLNMPVWHDAYAMGQREGEIARSAPTVIRPLSCTKKPSLIQPRDGAA